MLCALSRGAPHPPTLDFPDLISNSGASFEARKTPKTPFSPGGIGMKRLGLVMVAVALCAVAARPAMAQGVRYGVSAGVLLPMGNYGDVDKMGFVGGVGA